MELSSAHIESLHKLLEHSSGLVRGCAAAALALVSGSLDDDSAVVLAELVEEPSSLPKPWGWVNYRTRENSVEVGVAERVNKTETPTFVV